MSDALINRIADKAMALSAGDIAGTAKWLQSLGCKITYQTENELHVQGLVHMTVGFSRGTDPNNCAVQLGFALAGQFWPQVYPGLLAEVNKRWHELRGPGYSKAGKRKNPNLFILAGDDSWLNSKVTKWPRRKMLDVYIGKSKGKISPEAMGHELAHVSLGHKHGTKSLGHAKNKDKMRWKLIAQEFEAWDYTLQRAEPHYYDPLPMMTGMKGHIEDLFLHDYPAASRLWESVYKLMLIHRNKFSSFPDKKSFLNFSAFFNRANPLRGPGDYRRFNMKGAIDDLVGTLYDPIIVWKGMEEPSYIPDWLKKQITLDRIIEAQKELPSGTDTEALAFLMTASLAIPAGKLMHDMYVYLAQKEFKRMGTSIPPSDMKMVPELTPELDLEIRKLKRWIYDERLKYRERKRKRK